MARHVNARLTLNEHWELVPLISNRYGLYPLDLTTKKSQLWPLLTQQSHAPGFITHKPPLPCSVKHNAKCRIKVFTVEVWKHIYNKKDVLGYYHLPSLRTWWPKYTFGNVLPYSFLVRIDVVHVCFDIFQKKNICTVCLLSTMRVVLGHFYSITCVGDFW